MKQAPFIALIMCEWCPEPVTHAFKDGTKACTKHAEMHRPNALLERHDFRMSA